MNQQLTIDTANERGISIEEAARLLASVPAGTPLPEFGATMPEAYSLTTLSDQPRPEVDLSGVAQSAGDSPAEPKHFTSVEELLAADAATLPPEPGQTPETCLYHQANQACAALVQNPELLKVILVKLAYLGFQTPKFGS